MFSEVLIVPQRLLCFGRKFALDVDSADECSRLSVRLQEYLPLGHMRRAKKAAPVAAAKNGNAAQAGPTQASIPENRCVRSSSLCALFLCG